MKKLILFLLLIQPLDISEIEMWETRNAALEVAILETHESVLMAEAKIYWFGKVKEGLE